MRKISIVVIALSIFAVGCINHRRSDAAESGNPSDKIAQPNVAADYKYSLADKAGASADLKEREEIRKAYKLDPDSKVKIYSINGSLDVETSETDIAEILIIRSANNKEDLAKFKRVVINFKDEKNQLSIGFTDDKGSPISHIFGGNAETRQRVILRLPQKIRLQTHGVNGQVNIGKIAGRVDINGVNGEIKIAEALSELEMHGINGNIDASVANLANRGIEMNGINGNIALRFIGDIGAKIEAHGFNGEMKPDLGSDLKVIKNEGWGNYEASIGNGGVRIEFNGINGNITLTKTAQAQK